MHPGADDHTAVDAARTPAQQPAPGAAAESVSDEDSCPHCGHEVSEAWLRCAWCGEHLAAPAELPVGARLADGRYQVLRVIGRGGFGITYEVGDRRLQRRVAVKELFPESAVRHGSVVLTPPGGRSAFKTARERFLREARVLARFTHPGIVRVYEVFEEHGTAYLVMELLDGRTLIDLLRARGHPFAEPEVLDVAGRVAAALRPVHAAGVLHRDVNPSNVMMTAHGRIVVIDFGLARDYDEDRTVGMTRVVTPGYAPLEQYRGEARFGPSTDVYGLAATLYRLATGRVPVAAVERDGGAPLIPVHRHNPAISKAVSDAIGDGLELEPAHRPQDLDSFLSRLGIAALPKGTRSLLLDAEDLQRSQDAGPVPWIAPRSEDHPVGGAPGAEGAGPGGSNGSNGATSPPVAGDGAGLPTDHTIVDPQRRPGDPDRTVHDAHRMATIQHRQTPGGPAASADPDATHVPAAGRSVDPDLTRAQGGTRTAAAPVAGHDPSRTTVAGPMGGVGAMGAAPPMRPMTAAAAVPGSEHRLPVAVGPHRPGRRKLTVPLVALAAAAGMAAPVLATMLVVLVALPALATFGDSVAHRLRSDHGVAGGWAERKLSPAALAPVRFLRNVVVSLVRSSPIVGIGAALVGAWYGLARTDLPTGLLNASLRLIGLVTLCSIVAAAREGSARFRTGFGLDELVLRHVPDGRTTERLVIFWLVSAALVAGALWLVPDTFPIPSP